MSPLRSTTVLGIATLAAATLLSAPGGAESKFLPRSVYLPFEFVLCEHLQKAVLYQDELPVSAMPAHRVFQFTYYPDLEKLLPQLVQVRVEGSYVDDGSPFLAKLAITPDGIHTANSHKGLDTSKSVLKQRHKIDIRVEPRTLVLKCDRFCGRSNAVASTLYQ
jgi:hypothetical protein